MSNGHAVRLILTCFILCLFWHSPSRADDLPEERFNALEQSVTGDETARTLELLSRIRHTLEIFSRENKDDSLSRVIDNYLQSIRDAQGYIHNSNRLEPQNEDRSSLQALSLSELLEKIEMNATRPSPDDREDRRLGRRLAAYSYFDTNPENINRYAVLSVERNLRLRRAHWEIPIKTYASIFALVLSFQPGMHENRTISQWLDDVNEAYTALTNHFITTECKQCVSNAIWCWFVYVVSLYLSVGK